MAIRGTMTLVAAAMVLGAHAMAGGEPTKPRVIAPPTRIPEIVPESTQPAGTPVNAASVPRAVRRAVVADAARRFSVAESAVVLVSAEQVTWSDGSLGCAEPGQMYTQAVVSGYRVTAKTQEGQMRYHTDDRGTVVNCGGDRYRPGKKTLPADPAGTGAEPRTQPPAGNTPDR
jgi:hypothetical protein